MEEFFAIIFIAGFVEFVIENIKKHLSEQFYEKIKNYIPVVSIILSVSLCTFYAIDLFSQLGFSSSPTLFGAAVTGIATAAGTEALYKLLKLVGVRTEQVEMKNTETKKELE